MSRGSALSWRHAKKGVIMNFIMLRAGKMLFPNLPRDLRRRKMNVVAVTAITSLMLAGIIVVVMTMMLKMTGH
jgi:hypothetical protein